MHGKARFLNAREVEVSALAITPAGSSHTVFSSSNVNTIGGVPVGRLADRLEDALPSTQPVNVPSSPAPKPERQLLFIADIACLPCGRPVGTARSHRWPPKGPVLFQPAGSSNARPLANIWRLRCPVCGGNTAADEITVRTARLEGPTDWKADSPRRGRPPKWLAVLRQAGGPDGA